MRDVLKLWSLELRRGRSMLIIASAAIALVGLIYFSGSLFKSGQIALRYLASLALIVTGWFVSSDVVRRDFRKKNIDFYLSLPIPDWKLYLAKYSASVMVFAFFASLPLAMLVTDSFAHNRNVEASVLLLTITALFLLLIQTMIFVWTVALRGEGCVLFSMTMTPLALLLLWPGLTWFYYPDNRHDQLDPFGLCVYVLGWTLFFIIGGLRLWIIGICRGRSLLKPGLFYFFVLAGTSLALWSVFQAIDITDYLVTLRKFEHTPGVEIVKGSFRVPEAIMKFNAQRSQRTEDLLALDFTKESSIPPEAYPAYCRQLGEFREALFSAYERELSRDGSPGLIPILSLLEKYPRETIPLLATYQWREDFRHPVPESRDFWFRGDRVSIMRFYRPVPGLTDFLKTLPRNNSGLLRVVAAPRDGLVMASDGTSYSGARPDPFFPSDDSLRNFLPGADREGWSRLGAVIEWVLKRNFSDRPFLGSELRKATDTMKLRMAAIAAERKLNIAVRPAEIPDHIRNFLLNRPQRSLTAQTRSIINHCLNLPYLRLREYLKTSGELPDDPAIVLTPEEKGRIELRYCVGTHRKHRSADKSESGRIFLHTNFTGLPEEQHLCLELPPAKNKRGEARHE